MHLTPTGFEESAAMPAEAGQFEGFRQGIVRMYTDPDREAALVRGAHLNAVIRLTPHMMTANMGSCGLVFWAFRDAVPPGMWLWGAVLALVAAWSVWGWLKQRHQLRETASTRAVHRASLHAALLAGIWAVVTLVWFGGASLSQQLLVATLFTGMLGAGTFVLNPLPVASMCYAVIYALSSLGALWLGGNPMFAGVAALLGFYTAMVMIGSLFAWRKSTALLQAIAQAKRQERMLAVLLQDFEQHADEALWETGIDGRISHSSPRLAELLGLAGGELTAQPFGRLLASRDPEGARALQQAFETGRPFRGLPLSWVRAGGAARHIALNGKQLLDGQGLAVGWRGVAADVSEKVERERQLKQLAHTDSLTGLANRFTLREGLAQALGRGLPVALLTVDLDHFKAVNDSLGHTAGDELLCAVALQLSGASRPGDLVARLGGDEFALLMRHPVTLDEAGRQAQRLIEVLAQPTNLQGRRLRVGASVGVALCDDAGIGVDGLLAQSDTALYAAKEGGRGRFTVYAPYLGERSRRRVNIEHGLRRALELGQLSLHWQPKVDIASWRIVGAEALMRWTHPELGEVGPVEFIAVAEHGGMIDELGTWALREACRVAAGPLAGLTVSVNVSPVQFRDGHLAARVRDALAEFQTVPALLELEITESVFMDDVDSALEQLHALRRLGVRVALDDFGTGYSSLAYLRRFPFETLKIDRSFVSEMLLRKDASAIVQMIFHLAATLGMKTVAEGVETLQQLSAVARSGCHEMQGYLVSRPVPLDAFCQLWSAWPADRPDLESAAGG